MAVAGEADWSRKDCVHPPPEVSHLTYAWVYMLIFAHPFGSSSPDPSPKPSIKFLTPYWHLQGIKRILRNVICVEFIHLSHDSVTIWLMRFREQQEFDPSGSLEASQSEVGAFENFKAAQLRTRYRGRYWGGRQGASDCMDSVEGAGEHKVVIGG